MFGCFGMISIQELAKSLSTCDRASSSIVTSISVFKMIQKSQTCIQMISMKIIKIR